MGLEVAGKIVDLSEKMNEDDPKIIRKRCQIIRDAISDLKKIKEPSATQLSELERLKNQLAELESKL